MTDDAQGDPPRGNRLQEAIRAALETAAETGWFRGPTHEVLEATLARLDEKLGAETTGVHYTVDSAPDHCLVVAHSSDPAALDVVGSFMHTAGATTLGSAGVWLLPLDGVPVNRWLRALRRVISVEQRTMGDASGLPIRLMAVWARDDELVLSNIR